MTGQNALDRLDEDLRGFEETYADFVLVRAAIQAAEQLDALGPPMRSRYSGDVSWWSASKKLTSALAALRETP